MPMFDVEVTHTITITRTVRIRAGNDEGAESAAEAKTLKDLENLTISMPSIWDVSTATDFEVVS